MIRVFGITGTNGKTTASWMLRSILEETSPCGLIGTIEHIAGDMHYIPKNTTPGKELLQQLFSEMSQKEIGQCVMEVSSHGISQGRVAEVKFAGLGFTNLSRDHLDYHKSMEEYYQVKKSLFTDNDIYMAVNMDDDYGRRLYTELFELYGAEKLKKFSSVCSEADIYGKILSQSFSGSEVALYENGVLLGNINVPMAGEHFVTDALLAVTMARQANVSFGIIRSGLGKFRGVAGRNECVGSADDTLGIVDYAHTPDSLERLLKTVSELTRGRLICVFGCGGFRDKGKRRLMGEIAGRYSDYCVITSDNPRGEPPENIALAIEEGMHPTGCGYSIILDRYQAIKRAVALADKWDTIVVAGKGHETYQISGDVCVPFNDKEVLKELLEKKYEKTYDERD